VHEDERPTPDQIVAHDFFKLGYIPLHLDSACTSRIPKWPQTGSLTAATKRRGYTEEWWQLCKASAVGEFEKNKFFGAYGSRRNKTVARDCQKEIEAGKQPSIPFAKDVVYVPFPARVHWPHQAPGGLSEISEEKESSGEGPALVETTGNDRPKGRLPRITRREEQPLPRLKENLEPAPASISAPEPEPEPDAAPKILDKKPTRLRSVRKMNQPTKITALAAAATVTVMTAAPAPSRASREARASTRARTTKGSANEAPRVTATGLPDLPPLDFGRASAQAVEKPEAQSQTRAARHSPRYRTIAQDMAFSDPMSVLARLVLFRDNLARALDKKPTKSRRDQFPQLPFVAKWVDYSRRYGVGYVLDDGSIGTLLSAEEQYPVTIAFATDGYSHLRKAGNNRELAKSVALNYYTTVSQDRGLSPIEVLEKRRIEEIRTVWHKFGKYMCATFGDEEKPMRKDPRVNFVKFYQRLGNVGIWGFDDGAFQVRLACTSAACGLTASSSSIFLIILSLSCPRTLDTGTSCACPWVRPASSRRRATCHGDTSRQEPTYGDRCNNCCTALSTRQTRTRSSRRATSSGPRSNLSTR